MTEHFGPWTLHKKMPMCWRCVDTNVPENASQLFNPAYFYFICEQIFVQKHRLTSIEVNGIFLQTLVPSPESFTCSLWPALTFLSWSSWFTLSLGSGFACKRTFTINTDKMNSNKVQNPRRKLDDIKVFTLVLFLPVQSLLMRYRSSLTCFASLPFLIITLPQT